MTTTRHTLTALALLGLAAAPGAHAQATFTGTVTTSTTAPTLSMIAQSDFSGTMANNTDYTDNGSVAQGFMPTTAFTLGSVTMKSGGSATNVAAGNGYNGTGATFTLTIGNSLNGGYNLNALDNFTYSSTALTGTGEYFTFDTSKANIQLAANTQYFIQIASSVGYYGLARSTGDVYPGGFNYASVYYTGNNLGYDRTFFLGAAAPAATPEPSQTAALGLGVLGLAGLALKARKRYAA